MIATKHIRLPRELIKAMVEHAFTELPNECCGLLLGREGTIEHIIPMKSNPPAPDAYFMDPLQQVEVFTKMEARGEALLGIYHSHPAGPATPSGADLQLAYHPDTVYFIISLADREKPEVRGFMLAERAFKEVELALL